MEVFTTQREFNNKFKSNLFVCPKCNKLTENKFICPNCNNQSNNFIYKGFTFKILETETIQTIFTPIELTNNLGLIPQTKKKG